MSDPTPDQNAPDPATAPPAPREESPVVPDPAVTTAQDQVPAEEPIAPGVPRLGVPRGAARRAVDPSRSHPSFVFLAVVSIVTLASDIGTKLWAEKRLEQNPPFAQIWDNHLTFTLAKNRGGAWGLLQGANENVRRPFFLLVSVAAIAFIVTLYRRLQPRQRALKWGLPLVLGGALGNVFDRIRYGHVIDFIDYRAEWVRKMNDLVERAAGWVQHVVFHAPPHEPGWTTDHWPTFNVADIAICVGVGLMAVDMFASKRAEKAKKKAAAAASP